MKLLIIDDSSVARVLIKNELEPFFTPKDIILEASDGFEGIEMYKKYKPDICFVDLTMPNMDGMTVIDKIREFDVNSYLIVLTADIQKIIKTKAIEAGVIKYLNKPLKNKQIEEILKEIKELK